jgi:hypothetical protein
MITHTPLASCLYIKTLVARQSPTIIIIVYTFITIFFNIFYHNLQEILSQHATAFINARSSSSESSSHGGGHSQQFRRGSWFSICGMLTLLLAVLYLYGLWLFLHDLASNGRLF